MKDLEVWEDSSPTHWDEMVCQFNGTVFHSSIWAEYQKNIQNAVPVFIFAKGKTSEAGVGTVALFRQSRLPIVSTFVRELVLLAHPFTGLGDGNESRKFFEQCEELGRQWGCSRLSIESFYSGYSSFVPEEHGYEESRRVEFYLDLQRENSNLWLGIKKDQRERIRRLERQGIVITEGTSLDDLKGLKLVREATQGKRALRGQNYSISKDETMYQQLDQYLTKRGIGRVFLAMQEGEVIAAIFFATFNGTAYSVFSGSTTAGYKLSAQSGLFWEAVKRFQSEGFRELNRGGVPESASLEGDPLYGIYQFKKRLGTTPLTCRSGMKILNPLKEKLSRTWESVKALR